MPQYAELFWTPQLPEHWIACTNEDDWVMFPATENGWNARLPYRGHLVSLRPCDPATVKLAKMSSNARFDIMAIFDRPWIVPVKLPVGL